ncbi:MAG: glycosyltransferase family 39 protein [Anaerolineae bacterium]|nr:glycosyltransferase family 39 protein [Anaerolineae bacterium]
MTSASDNLSDAPTALAAWRESIRRVQWQSLAFLVGGLLAMYAGQAQLFEGRTNASTSGGWVFLLVGLGMVIYGLRGAVIRDDGAFPDAAPAPSGMAARGVLRLRPAWLALAVGLAIFTGWRSTQSPQEAYVWEHLLVWGLSMAALVKSIAPPADQPARTDRQPLRRGELALLVSILLVAFLLRFSDLQHNPVIFDQDEGSFALEGTAIRGDRNFQVSPYHAGVYGFRIGYQILVGFSTGIFGQTAFAARLPAVLLGALGVGAAYLVGRELLGWRGGLATALFMASWSYHIQFTRISLNQAGDHAFAALAFYFLLRGIRCRAPVDYALSALMLAISQLFYLGGVFTTAVLAAYLLFIALFRRDMLHRQWRSLGAFVVAAMVVTLPMHIHMLHFRQAYVPRTGTTSLGSGQVQRAIDDGRLGEYLGEQVHYSFLALFHYGDRSGWYGRGSNLLGLVGGPLLLIGAAMSLFVIWRWPHLSLPLGWSLAVVVMGSTLTTSPPQYQRYFPGATAFSLLVALGAAALAVGVARALNRYSLRHNLLVALGLLIFAGNLIFYLGVYVPTRPYFNSRITYATNATAQAMLQASREGRQVVLLGTFSTGVENTVAVRYLMYGRSYVVFDSLDLTRIDPGAWLAVIVAPEQNDALAVLRRRYPDGRVRRVILDYDGSTGFYVFERGGFSDG